MLSYQPFVTFFQLVLSTHPLLFCQILSPFQTFVIFSPFLIYSLFTSSTHPINAPAPYAKQHNRLSNSTVAFGHPAILIWGGSGRAMGEGFLLEQPGTLHPLRWLGFQVTILPRLNN